MPHAVVVGGGVIGTTTAYYLHAAGWGVTVLERAAVGAACSRGNCGYVCPSHALPLAVPGAVWATLKTLFAANSPLKVRPAAVLANLGWFLGFARKCNTADMMHAARGIHALLQSSRILYADLIRDTGIDPEWDESGLWFLYQSESAFRHHADTDRLLRAEFGIPGDKYDAEMLHREEPALKPGSVAGGYLYKGDAQLRPDVLMRELHTLLTARGVNVVENAEVIGLTVAGDTATAVQTATAEYKADAVVFAAGAWTARLRSLLGVTVPIVPGKGYSLTYPPVPDGPRRPMIFEEHRVAVSPFRTGFRIGSTMEFAGFDDTLNRKRLGLLTAGAGHYLNLPAGPPTDEWWGWRPMVFDGNPLIGPAPVAGNVIVAAGHGMLGLSMATGTGKLVAELLSGAPPHVDPAAYSLGRFR